MKTLQKTLLAIVVLVACLLTLRWWLADSALVTDRLTPVTDVSPQSGAEGSSVTPALPGEPQFETGLETLPPSLRGTEVDGGFEVDEQGHLIITRRVRNLFDYFLSTLGEEPLEVIVARLRAYIDHQLQQPANSEAHALLEGYLAYLEGLEGISEGASFRDGQLDVVTLRNRLDQLAALRAQHLPLEAVDAFFAEEDAYDRYVLDRHALMQDDSLSEQQRDERMAALEQQLPVPLRESLAVATQYQDLLSATQDCEQRDCSPAELRAVREEIVGVEAADRLEALDREEAEWEQRLNSWLQQRDAILANASLAETDRQNQVDNQRRQLFAEDELMRVRSLEALHDQAAQ